MEQWRDIVGYEGLYQVSNQGNVRLLEHKARGEGKSELTIKAVNKKPSIKDGYFIVMLKKDSKQSMKQVHRLVAEAFLPNPYSKPEVNHMDLNKLNNNVDNLEWVTGEENLLHAQAFADCTKCKPVIVDGYKRVRSIREAARQCGVTSKDIRNVLNGKQRHSHGHTFEMA